MGAGERRAREKEELRRKILDAASKVFAEEGYEQVTMRRIADEIEYSPSTIYLHFKDKNDLIASVCEETFQHLDEQLEAIRRQDLPPLDTLRHSLDRYIRFGLDHPNQYLITFGVPAPKASDSNVANGFQRVLEQGLCALQRLKAALQACQDAGAIRREDIEKQAQITWAMLHGLVGLLVLNSGCRFSDREVLVSGMVDRIVRSVAKQAQKQAAQ